MFALAQRYLVAERQISSQTDPEKAYRLFRLINDELETRLVPYYKSVEPLIDKNTNLEHKLDLLLQVPWIIPVISPTTGSSAKDTIIIKGEQIVRFLNPHMNSYILLEDYKNDLKKKGSICSIAKDIRTAPITEITVRTQPIEIVEKKVKPPKILTKKKKDKTKAIIRKTQIEEDDDSSDTLLSNITQIGGSVAPSDKTPEEKETFFQKLNPDEITDVYMAPVKRYDADYLEPGMITYDFDAPILSETLDVPSIFNIDLLADTLLGIRRMALSLKGEYTLHGLIVDPMILRFDIENVNFATSWSGRMNRIIAITSLLDSNIEPSRLMPWGGVFPTYPAILKKPIHWGWEELIQASSICGYIPNGIHPAYDWIELEQFRNDFVSKDPKSLSLKLFIDFMYYRLTHLMAWASNSSSPSIPHPILPMYTVRKGAVVDALKLPLVKKTYSNQMVLRSYIWHIYTNGGTLSIKKVLSFIKRQPIDYERFKSLRRLARELQKYTRTTAPGGKTQIPPDVKPVLDRFMRETKVVDEQYVDKESDIIIECTHVLYNLLTGKSTIDAYGKMANDNFEIRCRVCGQALVLDWLRMTPLSGIGSAESGFVDEIFSVVGRIIDYAVVTTLIGRAELYNEIVNTLSEALANELKKLDALTMLERTRKQKFVILSAVITLLYVASKKIKQFQFSGKNLRRMIRAEYMELLVQNGFAIETAIDNMLNYWTAGLSKHFTDPDSVLNNFIISTVKVPDARTMRQKYGAPLLDIISSLLNTKPDLLEEVKPEMFNSEGPKIEDISKELHKGNLPPPSFFALWARMIVDIYKKGPIEAYADIMKQIYNIEKEPGKVVFKLYKPKEVGLPSRWTTMTQLKEDKSEIRSQFENEIILLCPARQDAFLPHEWKDDDTCKYCGINKSLRVTDAYYAKYANFVLNKWRTPKQSVDTVVSVGLTFKPSTVTIDKTINNKLIGRFANIYGKPIIVYDDNIYITNIVSILAAIGQYPLAEMLKKKPKELLATAWNRIMEWGLKTEEKDWLKRQMIYLKSTQLSNKVNM